MVCLLTVMNCIESTRNFLSESSLNPRNKDLTDVHTSQRFIKVLLGPMSHVEICDAMTSNVTGFLSKSESGFSARNSQEQDGWLQTSNAFYLHSINKTSPPPPAFLQRSNGNEEPGQIGWRVLLLQTFSL